ncbi:MAG: WYL domain-containing protein [Bacteroidota bacterium]
MPVNKSAALRYRIIDRCISNKYKPFPTKEDLRSACEEELYGSNSGRISISTIEKDIWAMRNESNLAYNAPIEFSKREGGYFYTDPDYKLGDVPLNEEEMDAVRFAALTLYQYKDVEVFEQFRYAIEKIAGRVKMSPDLQDTAVERFVQFETVPYFKGTEYLTDLLNAIKASKKVSFKYENIYKNETKEYSVEPYLLKEYRNRWYLICFNETKNDFVTFGLDRISDLKIEAKKYLRKKDFDPDVFFKYSIGITEYDAKPQKVVLSFSPVLGKLIKTNPMHSSQKIVLENETELRVSLDVLLTIELQNLILGFGNNVKVLEPVKLKNDVQEQIKKMLELYR